VNGPDYRSVMEKAGTIPTSSTPAEMATLIGDTARDMGALIKDLGIAQLD
jgi:tripartite-type tricarboxylate transporter receptor subunit TctC